MNAASFIVIAAVVVLTGSLLLVGLAVGARRLLGLQLGVVRTVLAGLVGSAAFLVFGLTILQPLHQPPGQPPSCSPPCSWGSRCWSR